MSCSPKFKNLSSGSKRSPIELKEKMRKDYKNKVQNCRSMLMDRFRNSLIEKELYYTLTDIYESTFTYVDEPSNEEEYESTEEIKNELIQEELEWLIKEHEKCENDNIDWLLIQEDNNVICPICQRTNLQLLQNSLMCSCCIFNIHTLKSLPEIKQLILSSIEYHSSICNSVAHFGVMSQNIYLLCDTCMEMKLII